MRGKVTVDGQPVSSINSSFRVFAAYQGHGNLNDLLSVDATPQADGTFELRGLTPGTYLVQAARDGIWMSKPETLVVSNGSLPDLGLDIPEPGAAVDLTIVDKAGKRVPYAEIKIQGADGPLAHRLWPEMIIADCSGCLHLEGLSAGRLSLIICPTQSSVVGSIPVDRTGCTVTIDVPRYLASTTKRLKIQI